MGEAATDRRGGGRGLGLAQPAAPSGSVLDRYEEAAHHVRQDRHASTTSGDDAFPSRQAGEVRPANGRTARSAGTSGAPPRAEAPNPGSATPGGGHPGRGFTRGGRCLDRARIRTARRCRDRFRRTGAIGAVVPPGRTDHPAAIGSLSGARERSPVAPKGRQFVRTFTGAARFAGERRVSLRHSRGFFGRRQGPLSVDARNRRFVGDRSE